MILEGEGLQFYLKQIVKCFIAWGGGKVCDVQVYHLQTRMNRKGRWKRLQNNIYTTDYFNEEREMMRIKYEEK